MLEQPELSSGELNKPLRGQAHADPDLRLEGVQIKAAEVPTGSDPSLINRPRRNQDESSVPSSPALGYSEPSAIYGASDGLIGQARPEENV